MREKKKESRILTGPRRSVNEVQNIEPLNFESKKGEK